ncbi:MAG: lysophospholipid acyltransferase family protein, partial [Planctomycetota bacterium]
RTQRAAASLQFVHPHWHEDQCREYALRSYEHAARLFLEVAFTPRLITPDAWVRHVELDAIADSLRPMVNRGPTLMLTGHCGNWELLGFTVSVLGFPMHALYRPLDAKPVDDWLKRTRARRGLTLVDKFGAANVLPGVVASGEPVGFVADQNAGDRGLFVPFLGRLTSTYKTIGLLAMQQNATVVCSMARRLGPPGPTGAPAADVPITEGFSADLANRDDTGGIAYRIEVKDVIQPSDWADQPDPLFYLTARYRRALDQMVRSAPEQYLWMHRIWKSRPRHERLGRPFPPHLREKLASLPWMTDDEVEAIVDRSNQDAALLAELGVDRLP